MRIGFTCSAFDLFHTGHVLMLKDCKELCDYLLVGLQVNPALDRPSKNKPIQSVYERFVQLKGCRYVDEVTVYETESDLMSVIKTHKIDVRFLGEEYKDKEFTGKQYCIAHGIEIHYNKRHHDYSSTNLRTRIYDSFKSTS